MKAMAYSFPSIAYIELIQRGIQQMKSYQNMLALLALGIVPAHAADLTAEYLYGEWCYESMKAGDQVEQEGWLRLRRPPTRASLSGMRLPPERTALPQPSLLEMSAGGRPPSDSQPFQHPMLRRQPAHRY